MTFLTFLLSAVVITPLVGDQCQVGLSSETQERIEAYISALETARSSKSLVDLYEKSQALKSGTVIDDLTAMYNLCPKDFADLESQLQGLRLTGRGEVIVARPDLTFLRHLAEASSSKKDREFIHLMQTVSPEGSSWKVWEDPMTDHAGLLNLLAINASGVLQQLVSYLRDVEGGSYRNYAQAEFNEVVDWLVHETRFGDTQEVVLREYEEILDVLKEGPPYFSRIEDETRSSYTDVKRQYESIRDGDPRLQFELDGPF